MARPKKAVVDYFPHYVTHGKTMFSVEHRFGNDGYAFWFKTLELLGSSEHHFIDCNDVALWEFLLAKTKIEEETATKILDLLSKLGAIDEDLWVDKIIRSANFIDNLETVYSRRTVELVSNEDIRGLCIHKLPTNGQSDNINPQSKVKERKGKESNVKLEGMFDKFWHEYPYKEKKKDAKRIFIKLNMTDHFFNLVMDNLAKVKTTEKWTKENGKYIPLPTTWLNGERWNDEIIGTEDRSPKKTGIEGVYR